VWIYFATTFGFELTGTIEEKPGIAPGPQHVKATIAKGKMQGVKLILVDNFYDPDLPRRVGKDIGAKVVLLPNQPRGEAGVTDYFSLIERVIQKTTQP
jgi:ABC-type Zn uptake system ZnuABC Zn-binding protein ZnuA